MEQAERREIDLRGYVEVVRRRWLIIVLAVTLATLAALVFSFQQDKKYESKALVLVRPTFSAPTGQGQAPVGPSVAEAVASETAVIESPSVFIPAAQQLGQFPRIRVESNEDTAALYIVAKAGSADRAATVANVYARTYVEQRQKGLTASYEAAALQYQERTVELQGRLAEVNNEMADVRDRLAVSQDNAEITRLETELAQLEADRNTLTTRRAAYDQTLDQMQILAGLVQTSGPQLVSAALPSQRPVEPQPVRNALLGAFAGLVLGIGLAFLIDHLDEALRSKEELDALTGGLPTLASIPQVVVRNRDEARVVTLTSPTSAAAEAFRSLRTSLQFVGIEHPIGVTLVASADSGDGKTTTAANLAVAFARAGERVVLIDCDLRRPTVHTLFDVPNRVGFTSVLLGDAGLSEALQAVPGERNLAVLPSGPPPPNPSELLSSERTARIFESLSRESDIVIVDGPPILAVSDAAVLAGHVESVLLVVSVNRTPRRDIRRAIEVLSQIRAPLVGAVLNRSDTVRGYGYTYGYRYLPEEEETGEVARRRFGLFRRRGDRSRDEIDDEVAVP